MEKKTFVLRVFSVKDIQDRQRYANSNAPSVDRPVYEVRADSIDALPVSIFYRETDMDALPPTGSLIYVMVESAVGGRTITESEGNAAISIKATSDSIEQPTQHVHDRACRSAGECDPPLAKE